MTDPTAAEIHALMQLRHESTGLFARTMDVTRETVRLWTLGKRNMTRKHKARFRYLQRKALT